MSLATLFLCTFPVVTLAQWTKNESLEGGSIVSDIVEFEQAMFASCIGSGIFRSTDEGGIWSQTSVPPAYNETRMVVGNDKLVAISYGKTSVTTDGLNWVEGPGPDAFINDAAADGEAIFAATHLGLFKSADGGASWEINADTQLQVPIRSVSASGATVWASADLPATGTLFRSGDGGATWTKIIKGTKPIVDVNTTATEVYINISNDGIYKSANQGMDWQLVRNLANSYGKMIVSAAGIFYASPYNVFYSRNSGDTWQQKSKSYPYFNFNAIYATDNNIYLGLWGGGLLKTSHSDASGDWQFINDGIACHHIHDFAVGGNTLFVGLENSFLRTSQDLGSSWSQKSGPFGLFGFSVRALLVKDGVIYTGDAGVYKSTDGGATWMEKNQGLENSTILSIVSTANSLFVASTDGVYKSTNGGDTWTKKTSDGISMRKLYSNGTTLYAASYGGLFKSVDDGETWSVISEGLPQPSVNDVIAMGQVVLAATQFNGVYKTTNAGVTWTKVNEHLVNRFSTYNQYLFMSVGGQLLVSGDTAKTTEDIVAALPSGFVTYGGVIGDRIIVAKLNQGYWTREATTILKPYVVLSSPRPSNTLLPTESITLRSDQRLFSAPNVVISTTNISTHVSILDKHGSPVAFTAEVAPGGRSADITIGDPLLNEVYKVVVSPLFNENALSSAGTSAEFTVIDPIVTEVHEASATEVSIYPNPASSTVQVELVRANLITLQVYDGMGRQMLDPVSPNPLQTKQKIYHIDTHSYKPGLYLIRLNLGGRQVVSRFIKQ